MHYFRPLYAFLLGLIVLLNSATLAELAAINGMGQLVLFTLVVCIPIWRTGRMSYVDIGWPWGLVVLGIISFIDSQGYWLRSGIVSAVVILIGLRMGLGALKMWRMGLMMSRGAAKGKYSLLTLVQSLGARQCHILRGQCCGPGPFGN